MRRYKKKLGIGSSKPDVFDNRWKEQRDIEGGRKHPVPGQPEYLSPTKSLTPNKW